MKGKKKKELIKFKCFNYGDIGHYFLRCLIKNKQDDEKRKGM